MKCRKCYKSITTILDYIRHELIGKKDQCFYTLPRTSISYNWMYVPENKTAPSLTEVNLYLSLVGIMKLWPQKSLRPVKIQSFRQVHNSSCRCQQSCFLLWMTNILLQGTKEQRATARLPEDDPGDDEVGLPAKLVSKQQFACCSVLCVCKFHVGAGSHMAAR